MTLKTVSTENAPAAIGPYSQAVKAGSLLFVSGQLGLNPETGELAGNDLDSQSRQSLKNLVEIVKAAGGDVGDIVSVDVFLTDMGKFTEFNAIYAEYFSNHKPARAAIEVSALPKGGCVEIKCIASIN